MIDRTNQAGQVVAYLRVSTKDQNLDRQEAMAADAHRVFKEKKTGTHRDRPELKEALAYTRKGDTLVVWSVDRLARSIRDLKNITDEQVKKGVTVHFVKDNMTFSESEEATAIQKMQFNILGVFAEFERDISRERQAEGIAEAIKKDVYKNRKKKFALTAEQVEAIKASAALGVPKSKLAKDYHVSRQTIYTVLSDDAYGMQDRKSVV